MASEGPIGEADVHAALVCLSNPIELAQSDLARRLPQVSGIGPLNERGRALRSLLLEAIEALGPPRPTAFGSAESRVHDVLTLRYVERMATADMAEELSLSRRQIQRDLRRAEVLLAELVASWVTSSEPTAGPSPADGETSLLRELAFYSSRPAEVNLAEAMREVLATVAPLARSLGVKLQLGVEPDPSVHVLVDGAFLRTLMVQVASLAIQSTTSGAVRMGIARQRDVMGISLSFPAPDEPGVRRRLESIRSAAHSEEIGCQIDSSAGEITVTLQLNPSVGATILVVEDNPGAVDLYQRYLAGTGWELHAISDPRLCYQSVRTNKPDLVVLDIMMPHIEGWRVLRVLKEDPETAQTPVIVCSVVEDPALAEALGASAYLGKPVSRSDFISAINRCLQASHQSPAP
ncbi:MAG: response regulator [Anaerolineae bacterium]|nr:response regulator [Anaerolineae bacterium]